MIIFTFGNRPYCLRWALDFILLFYCFVASCCVVFVLLFMLFIAALRMYIHEFCYNIDRYTGPWLQWGVGGVTPPRRRACRQSY